LEKSEQSGVILFVMGRTVPVALTGAAQLQADENVHNHPS
jgi:hypothetical protein